jgi:hypothetical protein
LVKVSTRPEAKNDYAGEGQQQFNPPKPDSRLSVGGHGHGHESRETRSQ